MSKTWMAWNRALQLSVGCLALLLPLWLASAAVASGGCEPPPAPTKPNRK